MEKLGKETYRKVLERVQDIRTNGFKEKTPGAPAILPVGPVMGEERFVPTAEGNIKIYYHNPRHLHHIPVYFDFHGGGMSAGTAQQDEFICDEIAKELDVCVINVEYPLAPENPYPHGINASYEVVKYVLTHAERYDIDSTRSAFGGYSAGGCIAIDLMMLCNMRKELSYCGVMACYPGLQYTTKAMIDNDISLSTTSDVYGYSYYANGGDLNDPIANPVYAGPALLKDTPSVLLMTGERDPLRAQGETLAKHLMQANVPLIYLQFEGCVHGFTHRAYTEEPKEAMRMTLEYLNYIFTGGNKNVSVTQG